MFIFMLARCNQDGFLRVVPEAIAGPTGLSLERVSAALTFLEAPDPESGSPDEDGCRVVRVAPGTWTITNYAKYRNMRDADTVRSQTRERLARHREKKRTVTLSNAPKRQAEAEVDTEADKSTPFLNGKAVEGEWEKAFHEHFWAAVPRKIEKEDAIKAWMKLGRGLDLPNRERLLGRIMTRLEDRIRGEWSARPRDKIPYPASFLNAESFAPEDFNATA